MWCIIYLNICLICELALVSRLRFNTKIMYCPRVFILKKLHFFLKVDIRGYNTNNLNVLNLELSDWTV